MANPTWFIEQDYLTSKLDKLKAADPETYGSWTADDVKEAIEDAGLTPYDHFVAFNKAEGTSPNQYFNAYEYIGAKTKALNDAAFEGRNDWTHDEVKAALDTEGGAWAHYQQFGSSESVNPSNAFSVEGYYAAKAAELGGDWTAESVKEYFIENNVNALDHYLTVGKDEGLSPVAAPDDERVPSDPDSNVGESFTLTTGPDTITGTSGNDTIDGSVVNTLNANDLIIDESTTDSDVLNATINVAGVTATIKNIEAVNLKWTSNADLDVNATNMAGNTFNLDATGLAFTGNANITKAGNNNVNAGNKVTGTLTLTDVLNSTVNAGAAKNVTVDAGTPTQVGQKTAVAITVNGDATVTNTAGDLVDNLTIGASKAATVTLSDGAAGSAIDDKLTVVGSNDITVKGVVTGKTIANELQGAKLTVQATDAGALNLSKISADQIQVAAAAGAVTVADNQNLALVTGGSLTSLVANTGLTNVTTNLTTGQDIVALDVTAISNLNLEVAKNATIATLTTNAGNNVTVKGAGNLEVTASNGAAAIDASALTGTFTYTNDAAANTGVIGSATAKNTLTLAATAAATTVTAIAGAAADAITLNLSAGTLNVNAGAGDDVVTVAGALTGKATLDGGAGTDTLKVTNALGVATATGTSDVSLSGFEKLVTVTAANYNNVQLSGQALELSATSSDAQINVFVYDKSGTATTATVDLSTLKFGTVVGANVKTVNITGTDATVDTIKGTNVNDVIEAGKKGDIIDISQGGADIIKINIGDSTWAATSNNVDKITGFNATSSASTADQLDFVAASIASAAAAVDVKTAIKGGTGAEVVNATIDAKGLLTISGVDAGLIDTLEEWLSVATLAVADGGVTAGETVAFAFGGSTYVYNAADNAGAYDVVELVGLSGVVGVNATAAAANEVWIA